MNILQRESHVLIFFSTSTSISNRRTSMNAYPRTADIFKPKLKEYAQQEAQAAKIYDSIRASTTDV